MPNVMWDADGVLCDFVTRFVNIAHECFPDSISPGTIIKTWSFRDFLSDDEVEVVWNVIRKTTNFWELLEPMFTPEEREAVCSWLGRGDYQFYLVSNRERKSINSGSRPLEVQTIRWLACHLNSIFPVIFTDNKVKTCRDLNITIAIEDSPENISNLRESGVNVFVRDHPYNRLKELKDLPRGNSLIQFKKWVLNKFDVK